jgi:hypothetical protein
VVGTEVAEEPVFYTLPVCSLLHILLSYISYRFSLCLCHTLKTVSAGASETLYNYRVTRRHIQKEKQEYLTETFESKGSFSPVLA